MFLSLPARHRRNVTESQAGFTGFNLSHSLEGEGHLGGGEFDGLSWSEDVLLEMVLGGNVGSIREFFEDVMKTHGEEEGKKKVTAILNTRINKEPLLIHALGDSSEDSLHIGSRQNMEDVARYLVELGADVNVVDRNGNSPLLVVCRRPVWHAESRGDSSESKLSDYFMYDLKKAERIDSHNASMCRLLIEHGARVDYRGYAGRRTSLHSAVRRGAAVTVSTLLKHGARANVQDDNLYTPLHEVAANFESFPGSNCWRDIIWNLLSHNALPETTDRSGNTPFDVCAYAQHSTLNYDGVFNSIFRWFVDVVSNSESLETRNAAVGNLFKRVLRPAARAGFDFEIKKQHRALELLLDLVQTVAHTRCDGLVELFDVDLRQAYSELFVIACKHNLDRLVNKLLDHGANVNAVGPDGFTGMYWAARNGLLSLVLTLVDRGAVLSQAILDSLETTFDWETQAGRSAFTRYEFYPMILCKAARNGTIRPDDTESPVPSCRVIDIMASQVHTIVSEVYHGLTALHWAAENGHSDTVRVLLHYGADVRSRSVIRMRLPIHHAVIGAFLSPRVQYAEVVRLLLEADSPAIGADGLDRHYIEEQKMTVGYSAYQYALKLHHKSSRQTQKAIKLLGITKQKNFSGSQKVSFFKCFRRKRKGKRDGRVAPISTSNDGTSVLPAADEMIEIKDSGVSLTKRGSEVANDSGAGHDTNDLKSSKDENGVPNINVEKLADAAAAVAAQVAGDVPLTPTPCQLEDARGSIMESVEERLAVTQEQLEALKRTCDGELSSDQASAYRTELESHNHDLEEMLIALGELRGSDDPRRSRKRLFDDINRLLGDLVGPLKQNLTAIASAAPDGRLAGVGDRNEAMEETPGLGVEGGKVDATGEQGGAQEGIDSHKDGIVDTVAGGKTEEISGEGGGFRVGLGAMDRMVSQKQYHESVQAAMKDRTPLQDSRSPAYFDAVKQALEEKDKQELSAISVSQLEFRERVMTDVVRTFNSTNTAVRKTRRRAAIGMFCRFSWDYFIFLVLITVVGIHSTTRNDPNVAMFSEQIKNTFVDEPLPWLEYKVERNYLDIYNSTMFWSWVRGPMESALFAGTGDKSRYVKDVWRWVGTVRMRQVRVQKNACEIHPTMDDSAALDCYDKFSEINEEKAEMSINTNGVTFSTSPTTWNSAGHLDTDYYWTFMNGIVPGSGYIVDMPSTQADFDTYAQTLDSGGWIDRQTRVVFLDLILYNPNINTFALVKFIVEFPASGGVRPDFEIDMMFFYRLNTGGDWVVFIIEVLVSIIAIGYMITEFQELCIKVKPKEYFRVGWNYFDLAILILIGLNWVVRLILIWQVAVFDDNNFANDAAFINTTEYVNMEPVLAVTRIEKAFLSIIVLLMWLKVLKYLQYLPSIGPQTVALLSLFRNYNVLSFAVVFCWVHLSFVLALHVGFGSADLTYRNLGDTLLNVLRYSTGDVGDLLAINERKYFLGNVFLVAYFLAGYVIMRTMLIAVLQSTYEDILKNKEKHWDDLITFYLESDKVFLAPYPRRRLFLLWDVLYSIRRRLVCNFYNFISEVGKEYVDVTMGSDLCPGTYETHKEDARDSASRAQDLVESLPQRYDIADDMPRDKLEVEVDGLLRAAGDESFRRCLVVGVKRVERRNRRRKFHERTMDLGIENSLTPMKPESRQDSTPEEMLFDGPQQAEDGARSSDEVARDLSGLLDECGVQHVDSPRKELDISKLQQSLEDLKDEDDGSEAGMDVPAPNDPNNDGSHVALPEK